MKNLISTLFLGGALALGSCGNNNKENQKYQDFYNFILKEKTGNFVIFSKDNKKFSCSNLNTLFAGKPTISILVKNGEIGEGFIDHGLNGLDFYCFNYKKMTITCFDYDNEAINKKENKETFDSLVTNIPKWYKESKKLK